MISVGRWPSQNSKSRAVTVFLSKNFLNVMKMSWSATWNSPVVTVFQFKFRWKRLLHLGICFFYVLFLSRINWLEMRANIKLWQTTNPTLFFLNLKQLLIWSANLRSSVCSVVKAFTSQWEGHRIGSQSGIFFSGILVFCPCRCGFSLGSLVSSLRLKARTLLVNYCPKVWVRVWMIVSFVFVSLWWTKDPLLHSDCCF